MRKLYELEMTKEEVDWLIFAVSFLREERDHGDELPPFEQELEAQRDREEVGMTDILDSYPLQTGDKLTKQHDGTAFVVVYLDEKNNLWKEFRHNGESYIVKVSGKTTLRRYRGYSG